MHARRRFLLAVSVSCSLKATLAASILLRVGHLSGVYVPERSVVGRVRLLHASRGGLSGNRIEQVFGKERIRCWKLAFLDRRLVELHQVTPCHDLIAHQLGLEGADLSVFGGLFVVRFLMKGLLCFLLSG